MKKAVQFGAGNIGRGFIGALLSQSGYHVVFADVVDKIIDKINEKSSANPMPIWLIYAPLILPSEVYHRVVLCINLSYIQINKSYIVILFCPILLADFKQVIICILYESMICTFVCEVINFLCHLFVILVAVKDYCF